eukprot:CAMPEP_0183371412 /NCGR_PEP_ID=MMETSP0164_2-20130417/105311_1 /TAXON_ID=221442 /ORGANISM="Coccolithus pelagicus ssp braarudi, Strain PLY182g" /LENGTH=80 /DNA_ID=CAMNT_0025547953 /DNA_START=1 /DNA_END=239 /DNA_ORIENTATION=+
MPRSGAGMQSSARSNPLGSARSDLELPLMPELIHELLIQLSELALKATLPPAPEPGRASLDEYVPFPGEEPSISSSCTSP